MDAKGEADLMRLLLLLQELQRCANFVLGSRPPQI